MFEGAKLTKSTSFDKYEYFEYDIGFDKRGSFSLSDSSKFGKNFITFGAHMSLSVIIEDNRRKYILIIDNCPKAELHDTTLTAKKGFAKNLSEQQ